MASPLLGTLTIGQAPRADITPLLARHVDVGSCLHAGLLDGLGREHIERELAPRDGDATLLTRLLDGSAVVLGKRRLLPLMNQKLAALRAQGCRFVLLLCTGAFDGLDGHGLWLIEPDHSVPPCIAALAGQRQTGIVVPLPGQIGSEAGKWQPLRRTPLYAAASPYTDDEAGLEAAARELRERGAQLLVLDCMGYAERHREAAARASGLPVVLSNTLMARLTAELAAGAAAASTRFS